MKPIRIQRKRTKGWKMPKNTVYVGRPTIWGNPFSMGTPETLVELYGEYIQGYNRFHDSSPTPRDRTTEIRKELKGKNLACWCPLNQPCHADILLKIAND